jgi:hypothetical protein
MAYVFVVANLVPEEILIVESSVPFKDAASKIPIRSLIKGFFTWPEGTVWVAAYDETLEKAIQRYNKDFKTTFVTSTDQWRKWAIEGVPCRTLINGVFRTIPIKWVQWSLVVPEPVMMPNGISGYVCLGRCHGFFSCVEPNRPEGYICVDCR